MRKKMLAFLLSLVVFLGISGRVYAAELPDENRPGSLSIQLSFDGEALDGGMLTICRVARIAVVDGNAHFVLLDELSGGPSLNKLDDPDLAEKLASLAVKVNLPVLRAQIEDGKASFVDLEPGLYVITQRPQDVTAGFDEIRPFLLSLPQWIDGTYVYDLTASPKVPLETEPTEPQPTPPTEPRPEEPELPQTGQLNWPIPVLTVLGLSLFVAGWILCYRTRRDPDEA